MTSIAASPADSNTLVSSSRDHPCLVWKLQAGDSIEDPSLVMSCGIPLKSLQGHSQVSLSVDGQYALTASWDGTIRLWNVKTGKSEKTLSGHKKDVLSVCFSPDNRLIMSCGRDRTIKLWNTLGECQFTLDKESHNDWVTCVRFVPNMEEKPRIVSCGYDKLVKVWNLETMKVEYNLIGHSQVVNKVVVSPDGVLCASLRTTGSLWPPPTRSCCSIWRPRSAWPASSPSSRRDRPRLSCPTAPLSAGRWTEPRSLRDTCVGSEGDVRDIEKVGVVKVLF